MIQQINTNSVGSNNNRNSNVKRGGGTGQGGFGGSGDRRNNTSIAKSSLEGKLKGWCLYKLTIAEGLHRVTQLKKSRNTLPSLCGDKNFKYLNNEIYDNQEMAEVNLMLPYLVSEKSIFETN